MIFAGGEEGSGRRAGPRATTAENDCGSGTVSAGAGGGGSL